MIVKTFNISEIFKKELHEHVNYEKSHEDFKKLIKDCNSKRNEVKNEN